MCVGECAALQQSIDLATVVKYGGRSGLEMRVATVTDARQNDLLAALPGAELARSRRSAARRRQHRIAVTTEPPSPRNESTMYSRENEPFIVQRAVKAVAIPAGVEVNLKVGSVGYITQALGGSFTVYIDGSLFRIAGSDADSIDKEMAKPPEVPPGASDDDIKSVVWQQLKTCYDPEIPINIVDLGLVYKCDVQKNADETRTVEIKMTLTAPGCGMGEVLVQDVRDKVEIVPTVTKANVELLFDPPWNQTMMSEEARLRTGMM
jgi:probable FeS assembly SUF system protein SufT